MKFIKNEMLSHIGLCCHPQIQKLLLVNGNLEIEKEIKKHNIEITKIDGDKLNSMDKNSFDLVIINNSDGVNLNDVYGTLTDKGILIIDGKMDYKNVDKIKNLLENVGRKFLIAMPFNFDGEVALFYSKKYHPTADLILQKSDLIEDLKYYNSEIHLASFALPTAIKKSLISVLKH